ncbi:MAG: hypothetical protein DMD48_04395 [Gemmatimonadetes bacterium]|nr:MAG: hypothetical protein DMD48_04395 [Gemmatimonadota bacterium]
MLGRKGQFWRAHMAVRRVRQLGDPILRVRCTPVEDPKSPAVRLLSDDLRDTLHAGRKKYDMGRALAAPQIGAPVRVVLVEVGKFRATMVNPEITDVGAEDFHVWDDCFSFPNLLVRVILALDQPSGLDPFAYKAEWEKHHKPTERYGPPRPREI